MSGDTEDCEKARSRDYETMKSKEELAKEWGFGDGYCDGSGDHTTCRRAFLAGFDAGFQRAIEMLRSGDIANGGTANDYADWLENRLHKNVSEEK